MTTPAEKALAALNEYKKAVKANDIDGMDSASDVFNDAIIDVDEPLYSELSAAFDKMASGTLEEAVKEYGRVAKLLAGAVDAFELGAKMAEDGQAGLFFPWVAGELSELATTATKLRELAEDVIDQVDDLPDSIDADSAEELVSDGLAAKESIEELIEKLEEIKDVLTQ